MQKGEGLTVRWEDEHYVRVYTKDSPDLLALGWEARALLWEIMRKSDRAGILELGRSGVRGLAALTGIPLEVIQRALPVLLEDGCAVMTGSVIVIPNFIEAQESQRSDRQRQREFRSRAREKAIAQSRNSTEPETAVTKRDAVTASVTQITDAVTTSQVSVTLCSAVLCNADPESLSARDPVARSTASALDPARARMPTGHDLVVLFGAVRSEVFPATFPWNTARDTKGDAGSFAALLSADEVSDIRPTMRLALEKIRNGNHGWTNPELAVSPSFAFGKWKSDFTGLREELHGRTPVVQSPAHTREPDHRDVRIGAARADQSDHSKTGDIPV